MVFNHPEAFSVPDRNQDVPRRRPVRLAAFFALSALLAGIGLVVFVQFTSVSSHLTSRGGMFATPTIQMAELSAAASLRKKECDRTGNWKNIEDAMWTVNNGEDGGCFQFDAKRGRIRVCDEHPDSHVVRGTVGLVDLNHPQGRVVAEVHRGGKGHCRESSIPKYNKSNVYRFKVCLARSYDDPVGYCNMSDSKMWPRVERHGDYCQVVWERDGADAAVDCVGGLEEFCGSFVDNPLNKDRERLCGDRPEAITPPKPRNEKPNINARPDLSLPRGHAKGVGKVTEPLRPVLRWLVWTAAGGCVFGIIIFGGKLGLRHHRGEVDSYAGEFGWLMLACVMAGSGFAIAFVAIIVDPF
ncbi:hypothetical protein [Actinomadura montaniterrae]|uniref:Uncharacterized protein n=1 Tax=Actinomadura montaniterrae TaxID=1803903 RepID=A0A6L3W125_9ACTN|nr:hypothetical protein [Actinomadura montaniterrae]KAB2385949.1 hypothetical protein F9B16_09110 [Actinomadura montaniterrae]